MTDKEIQRLREAGFLDENKYHGHSQCTTCGKNPELPNAECETNNLVYCPVWWEKAMDYLENQNNEKSQKLGVDI